MFQGGSLVEIRADNVPDGVSAAISEDADHRTGGLMESGTQADWLTDSANAVRNLAA